MLWASQNQIVNGVGNQQFAPSMPITREQLAAMLCRYARYSGMDTSAEGRLSKFADGNQVSPWAEEAMAWAVGAGLISGREGSALAPAATATRAEVAQIFMNFLENVAG